MIDHNNIYFERTLSTMENLPFKDNQFGKIFFFGAIHHSNNICQCAREVHRLLQPGGEVILINEPMKGILRPQRDFGKKEIALGWNENIYTYLEYRRFFRKAGFKPYFYPSKTVINKFNKIFKSKFLLSIFEKTFFIHAIFFGMNFYLIAKKRLM